MATQLAAGPSPKALLAVQAALSQKGKPYRFGTPLLVPFAGNNPPSFDCSGLTAWSYHKAGIHRLDAVHFTGYQYATLAHIPVTQTDPGDLLFYDYNGDGTIDHVAMDLGNGQLIEAPQPGVPVHTRPWHPGDNGLKPLAGKFPGSHHGAPFHGVTGGTGGTVDTHPPIPPGSLHIPLTDAQRHTILNYLHSHGGMSQADIDFAITGSSFPGLNRPSILAGQHDPAMIQVYDNVVKGIRYHHAGPGEQTQTNPLTGLIGGIEGFFSRLFDPNLWLRIIEVVLGVGLLAVGVAKMAGSSSNPVITASKKIVGTVK